MDYAIETLRIEKYKLLETIRTQERYSIYPEYIPSNDDFYSRMAEIIKAIEIIEKAIKGE